MDYAGKTVLIYAACSGRSAVFARVFRAIQDKCPKAEVEYFGALQRCIIRSSTALLLGFCFSCRCFCCVVERKLSSSAWSDRTEPPYAPPRLRTFTGSLVGGSYRRLKQAAVSVELQADGATLPLPFCSWLHLRV